jgi:hypothetical protein
MPDVEYEPMTQSQRDAVIMKAIESEPMPDKPPSKEERENLPERLGVEDETQLAALLGLPRSAVVSYLEGRDPGILGLRLHRAVSLADKLSPRN